MFHVKIKTGDEWLTYQEHAEEIEAQRQFKRFTKNGVLSEDLRIEEDGNKLEYQDPDVTPEPIKGK